MVGVSTRFTKNKSFLNSKLDGLENIASKTSIYIIIIR